MISSEVQRTLVKSPPELWAELGDPTSLARHLGELGEIRITRLEPEKLVEWEAQAARGTVAIKASGWGTRVTLTASRELRVPEGEPDAPVTATAAERFGHEHSATLLGSDLERARESEPPASLPGAAAEAAVEPEPPAAAEVVGGPAPRRGFLARLFGRGRRLETSFAVVPAEAAGTPEATIEPPLAQAESQEPAKAPAEAQAAEEPVAVDEEGQPVDPAAEAAGALAAELKAAEEAAEEEVAAILKGVLDRLGAAHHRPFSRS